MRAAVGMGMGVNASGSIRTFEQAIQMPEAGATRIAASFGVTIIEALSKSSL